MKKIVLKKIAAFVLLLAFASVACFGCSASADAFSGEWRFSKIAKLALDPTLDEETIALLCENYGAEDEDGLLAAALASFEQDQIFNPCYIRFEKNNTYTYDPAMDREATWVFYKTSEKGGFLSFYTELDPSEVTPDPVVFPPVAYDAQTNTLSLTIQHTAFFVTVELTK